MSHEFWCGFFISCFFFIFTYMLLACIYFPKIEAPWFKRWWDIDWVRVVFAYGSLGLAYLSYMMAIMELSQIKPLLEK